MVAGGGVCRADCRRADCDPCLIKLTSPAWLESYQAQEFDGTWQVIDRVTALPATSAGRDFIELSKGDAVALAKELNRCETEGFPSPQI
jgi:hypothetical protein